MGPMEMNELVGEVCPVCGEGLHDYSKYLYCFRCSKQFKRRFFGGGLKEVENTIQNDQRKAMSRSR